MRKNAIAKIPKLLASKAVGAAGECSTKAHGLTHLSPKMRIIAEEWLTLHDAMDTVFVASAPWPNHLEIAWTLPDQKDPQFAEFSAGFQWGFFFTGRESWRAWGTQIS